MIGKHISKTKSMIHRRATHSGSWYASNASSLSADLDSWLSKVKTLPLSNGETTLVSPPISKANILIAPHAGYSYSGPTAAYAYAALDTSNIERVILLGPSHHVFIDGCALSPCDVFETPLGSFEASDLTEFENSGLFSKVSVHEDEDEHSLEMHLPYLYKRFKDDGRSLPKLVLIMVGRLTSRVDAYAAFLRSQLTPTTAWVVSTDFCHYGPRFKYTPSFACIHEEIEAMDREGMGYLQRMDFSGFEAYLDRTKNTICGRFPLKLLLRLLAPPLPCTLVWTQYAQSQRIQKNPREHSVSYVSGYIVLDHGA